MFDWRSAPGIANQLAKEFDGGSVKGFTAKDGKTGLKMTVAGGRKGRFATNVRGLGLSGGEFQQVDAGEALLIRFDRDVIVESAAIVAGNGVCGGFYQVADGATLAIYCVDADNDAKEQQGVISDIGVLLAGQTLRLDSRPHHGVEAAGRWRLGAIAVRILK